MALLKDSLANRDAAATAASAAAATAEAAQAALQVQLEVAQAAASEAEAQQAALQAQLQAAQAAANAAECRATDAAALVAEWKEQAVVLRQQLTASSAAASEQAAERAGEHETPRQQRPHPHPQKQQQWAIGSKADVCATLLEASESSELIPAAPAPLADPCSSTAVSVQAAVPEVQQAAAAAADVQPVVLQITVLEAPLPARSPQQHLEHLEVAALQQRCQRLAGEAAAVHEEAALAAAQHAQCLERLEREHQAMLAGLQADCNAQLARQAERHDDELRLLQQQHAEAVAAAAAAADIALAAAEGPTGSRSAGGGAGDRTPSPLQRRFQQKLRQVR